MKQRGLSSILVIVLVVISVGTVLFLILRNKQYIPKNIEDIQCISTTTVQGNSMEPAVKAGSILSLNKCTDKNNLSSGQIVLFEENNVKRIGRIKQRMERQDGIFYTITRDARPGEEFTISADNILASDQQENEK